MSGGLIIRPSRDGDIAAIAAIYRHHVLHSVASFEEVPPSAEEMALRRADIMALGLPYLVAERPGGPGEARVVGYCYAGPYRARSAYRYSLEDSIYIDPAEVGREHSIVLGKHSGTAAVKLAYERLGMALGDAEAHAILPKVRTLATRAKRAPTADELRAFREVVPA